MSLTALSKVDKFKKILDFKSKDKIFYKFKKITFKFV
jgi:hypothetical protein